MHEFSIAVNMVDIALDYAGRSNAEIVNEIELEIGDLSGVVIDAMTFAMEAATKGTILEKAKLKITQVPGKGRCRRAVIFSPSKIFMMPVLVAGLTIPKLSAGKNYV